MSQSTRPDSTAADDFDSVGDSANAIHLLSGRLGHLLLVVIGDTSPQHGNTAINFDSNLTKRAIPGAAQRQPHGFDDARSASDFATGSAALARLILSGGPPEKYNRPLRVTGAIALSNIVMNPSVERRELKKFGDWLTTASKERRPRLRARRRPPPAGGRRAVPTRAQLHLLPLLLTFTVLVLVASVLGSVTVNTPSLNSA